MVSYGFSRIISNMANQRSKRRNALIGVFVEPDVKAHVERAAKLKNMTVADYVRGLLRSEREKEQRKASKNDNH